MCNVIIIFVKITSVKNQLSYRFRYNFKLPQIISENIIPLDTQISNYLSNFLKSKNLPKKINTKMFHTLVRPDKSLSDNVLLLSSIRIVSCG